VIVQVTEETEADCVQDSRWYCWKLRNVIKCAGYNHICNSWELAQLLETHDIGLRLCTKTIRTGHQNSCTEFGRGEMEDIYSVWMFLVNSSFFIIFSSLVFASPPGKDGISMRSNTSGMQQMSGGDSLQARCTDRVPCSTNWLLDLWVYTIAYIGWLFHSWFHFYFFPMCTVAAQEVWAYRGGQWNGDMWPGAR